MKCFASTNHPANVSLSGFSARPQNGGRPNRNEHTVSQAVVSARKTAPRDKTMSPCYKPCATQNRCESEIAQNSYHRSKRYFTHNKKSPDGRFHRSFETGGRRGKAKVGKRKAETQQMADGNRTEVRQLPTAFRRLPTAFCCLLSLPLSALRFPYTASNNVRMLVGSENASLISAAASKIESTP